MVGTDPVLVKAFNMTPQGAQILTLVVRDNVSNLTDTLAENADLFVKFVVTGDSSPDLNICYGSRVSLKNYNADISGFEWLPKHGMLDSFYNWNFNVFPNLVTLPLTQDRQIVLKTWYYDECPSYDALNITDI